MTDQPNPFAEMMAMGQEWARAMNPALEHFTPKGFEALWPTMPKEVMETVMGHGVDYMMHTHAWHGKAPNDEQLEVALAQNPETLGDY